MKLIACSLIVLAGALALGMGAISTISRGADAQGVGYILLVIGGILFFKEYFIPADKTE